MSNLLLRVRTRQLIIKLRKIWAYYIDSDTRRKERDMLLDFKETKQQLDAFIGQGNKFETRSEAFAVFSFTTLPFKAKFFALIAKAMQLDGYSPYIVQNSVDPTEVYFQLFKFDQYIKWDEYQRLSLDGIQAAKAFEKELPSHFSLSSILACQHIGVPVGRYALSTCCRKIRRFPEDINEPIFKARLLQTIFNSIVAFHTAERFFNENPITRVLLHDIGYARNGPILDAALRKGIDCLVVSHAQRRGAWIFKRYTPDNLGEHEFSLSRRTWEQVRSLPLTSPMEQEIKDELDGRYSVNSDLDARRLQSGKSLMPLEEVRKLMELDPAKKTAVIFAHVSWDGAFFFGKDLFETFDDWLFQTAKAAIDNSHLNWIIKLHPLNILHYAMDGRSDFIESEMAYLSRLEPLPPHVRIMHSDTPINTLSLFPVIDYGLTVRGTVGVELPCYGIPVLTAGTGRYDDLGFTIDSDSQEAYFEKIKKLHTIPPLSEEQRKLARIHYYHLMLRRQVSFEDIAPMQIRQLNEADTSAFNNIHIQARNLDDIRNAKSIQSFVKWAHQMDSPDFMGPDFNAN